jgi:hypothetical protein
MSVTVVPWVMFCLTAVWFGWLAVLTGRNPALYALVGGLFGLASSTIVFGLGHAMFIPFSDGEMAAAHTRWTLISVCIIAVVGGALTWASLRKPLEPTGKP